MAVSFAVASGFGYVTRANDTTGPDGIAAVGGWTLGAREGRNTLTASAPGFIGSPVTFTAFATPDSIVSLELGVLPDSTPEFGDTLALVAEATGASGSRRTIDSITGPLVDFADRRWIAPWGVATDTLCAWASTRRACIAISVRPSALGYVATSGATTGFWLYRADGSRSQKLRTLSRPGFVYQPTWSAQRDEIAVENYNLLTLIDAERDDTIRVYSLPVQGSGEERWSPDGARIAFMFGSPDSTGVAVLNLATGVVSELAGVPCLGCLDDSACPAWSPDGTRIAFGRSASGIWVMNADGTSQTRVYAVGSSCPDWLADGRIVFADSGSYWSIQPDGSSRTYIAASSGGMYPRWAPSGQQVCFATDSGVSVLDVQHPPARPVAPEDARLWSCGWRR